MPFDHENSPMDDPIQHEPLAALLVDPNARHRDTGVTERRRADVEMARVLKTAPLQMASDPSSGAIAHWKHGALHDVVEPMTDHVIMTYPTGVQRLERRSGKSVAIGTARAGVVTIIPAYQAQDGISPASSTSSNSTFRIRRSNASCAKPTRPPSAISSNERVIPTLSYPGC